MFRSVLFAALCAGSLAAQAATIDFEDYTGPEGPVPSPFSSGGFTFIGTGNINTLVVSDLLGGTNSLLFCPGCEVVMSESAGSGFALNQLELQNSGSSTIDIVGTYGNGVTVQTTVDPGNGFSTIQFDSAWEGLISVRFVGDASGFGSGLDNINVDVVPVPAAVWLFASGLGLLGFARRRSR